MCIRDSQESNKKWFYIYWSVCGARYHCFNMHTEQGRTMIINWSLFWEQFIIHQVASENTHIGGASNYKSAQSNSFCVTTRNQYCIIKSFIVAIVTQHRKELQKFRDQFRDMRNVLFTPEYMDNQFKTGFIALHPNYQELAGDELYTNLVRSTGCIDHDITLWCHYLFHYLFICIGESSFSTARHPLAPALCNACWSWWR